MLPLAPSLLLILGAVKYRPMPKQPDAVREALEPGAGICSRPARKKPRLRLVK